MPGYCAYNRDMESEVRPLFTRATRGSCLSLMRYLVLHANYADTVFFGQPVLRGEICVSWPTIMGETGLTEKQVRTALNRCAALDLILRKGAVQRADRTSLYVIVRYNDWTLLFPKGRAEGRTGGASGADPSKNQEELREKEDTAGSVENPLHQREQRVLAAPWGTWIAAAVDHYHSAHPDAETLTPTSRVATMEVVLKVLQKDMCGVEGCTERLGNILRFALEDQFWRGNLRSLGALRRKSGAGGYKWQSIEAALRLSLPKGQRALVQERQYVTDRVPDGALGYRKVNHA